MSKAASDKPVGRTHRRGAALVAALALATTAIGAQTADAQSGGVGAPADTTTTTTPTTPTTPVPAGAAIFPVAGPHTFAQGVGARRSGGRSHQGQDILTACGTPLVANTRAKVKVVGYQGAAGNYLVIRNKTLHQDFAYMHLATPALVPKGTVVQPGQQLGIAGRTGNATACMLHFELWVGKWWRGGYPVDPMPYLQTYQGY